MQTITLPLNPANYFGTLPAVTNLSVGDVLYIGPRDVVEEMTIQSFERDDVNFIINTDKAVLVATRTTRVNRKDI
jgi:hypothetical protein